MFWILQDADRKPENFSIADELKQAAEEAVQETGYVYDESTGLYYDRNSGYYYDHVSRSFYWSSWNFAKMGENNKAVAIHVQYIW
jgi:hypothetical protein